MKTAEPVVFPREGIYVRPGIHIDFDCMTEEASIYYTLDGSDPTENSSCYKRENGLISLPNVPSHLNETVTETIVVKAMATSPGCQPSDIATFFYTIQRRATNSYISQLLRPLTKKAPGIMKIFDCDDENIYLVVGTKRALLIDAGIDNQGDLPSYVQRLLGNKNYDAILTHGHVDHYMQSWNLHDAGITVYLNQKDLPIAKHFSNHDLSFTTPIEEGEKFDLGNAIYQCYTVAGHSSAGTILVDEQNGDAFSGDAFGSNGSLAPDSHLLHLGNSEGVLDVYFSDFERFMRKTGKNVHHLYTGHNDSVVDAAVFLPTVERLLQDAVDRGEAAKKPSLRPQSDGITSSPHMLYTGNYRMAEDWACINIEKMFSGNMTSDTVSLLADLYLSNGELNPPFNPHIFEYTWYSDCVNCQITAQSMSTRIQAFRINGKDYQSKKSIGIYGDCVIDIVAPDGKTCTQYKITKASINKNEKEIDEKY